MVPLKLFEQHCRDAYPSLYRTAIWIIGNRDLAEDALQEALLKGYQALANLRDLEHLGGWLHRITVREALGVHVPRRSGKHARWHGTNPWQ